MMAGLSRKVIPGEFSSRVLKLARHLLIHCSVTPLKANFMHAAAKTEGELKL
jgi:hypothetical protein